MILKDLAAKDSAVEVPKVSSNTYNCIYHKIPKNSDTRKFAVITPKVEQGGFILE